MTSADFFIDGRAHFSVHEEQLKDVAKAYAFQDAIIGNTEVIWRGVVVEVIGVARPILWALAIVAYELHLLF